MRPTQTTLTLLALFTPYTSAYSCAGTVPRSVCSSMPSAFSANLQIHAATSTRLFTTHNLAASPTRNLYIRAASPIPPGNTKRPRPPGLPSGWQDMANAAKSKSAASGPIVNAIETAAPSVLRRVEKEVTYECDLKRVSAEECRKQASNFSSRASQDIDRKRGKGRTNVVAGMRRTIEAGAEATPAA
ncbi:hypothetical protein BT63DRAFT_429294 [Microthyrium microscopicum]|uniref:Uncharacterized protein n=1 Tax=Microthyrium microscopicum TaxID=703497 RepID=A0A6A6TXI5_9PEZI|nr:hypothetical protein BT63DRAFT_429294 [Microthyrium microscopicum]